MKKRIPVLKDFIASAYFMILKPRDYFPKYQIGSDIDLLVEDIDKAVTKFKRVFESLYDTEYLKFESYYYNTSHHVDIRVKSTNLLLVKFDLIEDFTKFENIQIKDTLVKDMYNAYTRIDDIFYVPTNEYDLLVRYLEYHEHVERRPKKSKHLKYIIDQLNGVEIVNMMLNQYTNLENMQVFTPGIKIEGKISER